MTKLVRWKCEICSSGLLAPSKPRKNDVRRYCLPCSKKIGKLVERSVPSLEKKVAKKKEKRKATAFRRQEIKANSFQTFKNDYRNYLTKYNSGFKIKSEAERIWNLFEPYHKGAKMPKIFVELHGLEFRRLQDGGVQILGGRGNAGEARYHLNEVMIKPNVGWGTLAHELCHFAVGSRYENGRYKSHDEVFYKALKDVSERRWKVRISFAEVTKYGYVVDGIIRSQIHEPYQAWLKVQEAKYGSRRPVWEKQNNEN